MDPDNSYREEAPVSMASRSADDENDSNPTGRSSSESAFLKTRGRCLKIGTWNVRTLYQPGKFENLIQEMQNMNLDILRIAETHWTGEGNTVQENHTMIYSGGYPEMAMLNASSGQGQSARCQHGTEVTVKTRKNLLKKTGGTDFMKGLLAYRAIPLANGKAPCQLLMGRRLKATLPVAPERLLPQEADNVTAWRLKEKDKVKQAKDKMTRSLGELARGDNVCVHDHHTGT